MSQRNTVTLVRTDRGTMFQRSEETMPDVSAHDPFRKLRVFKGEPPTLEDVLQSLPPEQQQVIAAAIEQAAKSRPPGPRAKPLPKESPSAGDSAGASSARPDLSKADAASAREFAVSMIDRLSELEIQKSAASGKPLSAAQAFARVVKTPLGSQFYRLADDLHMRAVSR